MKKENTETITEQGPRPRKANECFIEPGKFEPPLPLFDEFWREGELCLFFGAAGTGKSVLAVQIADALARGRGLDGFQMPRGRRKVLYVDLNLSDTQFQMRCSRYKFSENLYRDRPASTDDLCEWLGNMIAENGFQAVIIDDISAVKRTHDGTRETLALMRQLRRIKEKLDVSILVIADAESPREYVSEADLRRSRVLCGVADSVFAIGEHPKYYDKWCLVQTRSRSAGLHWNRRNAPVCKRVREDSGLLRLEFDERFAPKVDVLDMVRISVIAQLRKCGQTYRAIAEETGFSKSTVARLYKKWTPAMDNWLEKWREELGAEFCDTEMEGRGDAENQDGETDEFIWSAEPEKDGTTKGHEITRKAQETEDPQAAIADPQSADPQSRTRTLPQAVPTDPQLIPRATEPVGRTVYDLMRGIDAYGREIFIESEDERTGKPTVWYMLDRAGHKIRHERNMFCVKTERLGASAYL